MAKRQLGPTTHLFPMPTLLVAVKTGEASANVVTIAWAGIVGGDPPMMALDIAQSHYSAPFIDREGNFTVNVPNSSQAVEADYCGIVSGRQDPDKAKTCGWTMSPSTLISSPMIAECPLNFECRVVRKVEAGESVFYLAEVLETHVDERVLDSKGGIDAVLLDPLIFTPDGQYFRLGQPVAKAFSVGKSLKKKGH
ncbi:MAG: flavin reductase family protein [Anaerolineae bacterium]|nr:flavin reductase family protein [Anaerolineae bacterium]